MFEEETPGKFEISMMVEDVVPDIAIPGCNKKGGVIVVGIPYNLRDSVERLVFVQRSYFLKLAGVAAVAVATGTTAVGIHSQFAKLLL